MREGAPDAARSRTVVIAAIILACIVAALAFRLGAPVTFDLGSLFVAAGTAATISAIGFRAEARRRQAHDSKVSEELDTFAQCLLRLESQIANLDGSGSRADTTLTDMVGDVHSLSEVVRSLAESLTVQEAEIARLKQRAARSLSFQAMAMADSDRSEPVGGTPDDVGATPSFLPSRSLIERVLGSQAALPAPAQAASAPLLDHHRETDRIGRKAGRLDLHVEPVLALPQRRERLYGAYPMLRTADDRLLAPGHFDPPGGLPDFESSVLRQALNLARRLSDRRTSAQVIVPVSEASLRDVSFLRLLEELPVDHGPVMGSMVLQVAQRCWDETGEATPVLVALRQAGLAFALGGVADENLNSAALARRGVRYVRLPAERLLAEHNRANMSALALALSRAGIEVIADGVDDDAIVPELLDLGIPLAHGWGLALPYSADALLEPAAIEPEALGREPETPISRSGDAADEPLRNFLRRAL